MRILVLLLAAAASVLGVLTPSASAGSGTYSITLTPAPSGKTDPANSYNDTALDVSDSVSDGRHRTRIKGRVTGGPVVGRKVSITATNLSRRDHKRFYVGGATLTSTGFFTKTFDPGHDNAGIYRIEIKKSADRGRPAVVKAFTIRVYQFVEALNVYRADQPGVKYQKDAMPAYGTKYDQSYLVDGGSTLSFDFTGHTCLQANFKVARAAGADVDGWFSVTAGNTVMVPTRYLDGQQYNPPTSVQKLYDRGSVLRFTVRPHDDGNPETTDDNSRVRMIVGRPMVSCTYPVINP